MSSQIHSHALGLSYLTEKAEATCLEPSQIRLTISLQICSPLPCQSHALNLPFPPPETFSFKLAVDSSRLFWPQMSVLPTADLGEVLHLSVPSFFTAKYDSSNHLAPRDAVKMKFSSVVCFSMGPAVSAGSHPTFSFLHLSPLLFPGFFPLACRQAHLFPPLSGCPFL